MFKPKFALSVFDYGVTTYTGNSIFIEAHNQNEASFSEATDQTSLARFGTLSINFVLLYIFPLLVILLGYNTYTKEKEQQTLLLIKESRNSSLKTSPWKMVGNIFTYFNFNDSCIFNCWSGTYSTRRPSVF